MAITAMPSPIIWPGICATTGTLGGPSVMNASGDRHAFIVRAPKAGTLRGFGIYVGNPATAANGLRFSFQDVSATTGMPDGSVDQYRDIASGSLAINSWIQSADPLTSDGTNGGVKRTVSAGDYVCCVVDFTSFVALDSVLVRMSWGVAAEATEITENYGGNASTGTYARTTLNGGPFALQYDDGTYAVFAQWTVPMTTFTTRTFNSGSTPDERGFRFVPPMTLRVTGVWVRLDQTGDVTIVIYDAVDAVVATVTLDADIRGSNNPSITSARFTSSVALSSGVVYRVVVKPTTVTSVSTYDITLPSAAHMEAVPGGVDMYLTTRTDAGAWTDTTTQRPLMGLIIDGLDTTVGTGGGSYTFVG